MYFLICSSTGCSDKKCQNGATCIGSDTNYFCKCAEGFVGTLCQNVNPCFNNPCLPNGDCIVPNPDDTEDPIPHLCVCYEGWSGTNCNVCNPCTLDLNLCGDYGTCSLAPEGQDCEIECTCHDGWIGEYCNIQNPCTDDQACNGGGDCTPNVENPSQPDCHCHEGYLGQHCLPDPCYGDANPCGSNGVCFPDDLENPSYAVCDCEAGWIGQYCEFLDPCFDEMACNSNGICTPDVDDPTKPVCDCDIGYIGLTCLPDPCYEERNPCGPFGQCYPNDYDYPTQSECICDPGWLGEHCDVQDPCYGIANPCVHGSCSYDPNDISQAVCTCDSGWGGINCDRAQCSPGYYSTDGTEPCEPCPLNTYQSNPASVICIECGEGKITEDVGSTSPDDCIFPPLWPRGYYGLPMPDVGCPKSYYQKFTWQTGTRHQDTERGNEWSLPLHFPPRYALDSIDQHFCMKNVYSEQGDKEWEEGKYCLFKADNQICPSGFNEGSIKWDDRLMFNQNSLTGSHPEGKYGMNTEIHFCCRVNGYANEAISLPNNAPFYLLQYGDDCQKVKGMSSIKEWFFWDCNKWPPTVTSSSGWVPKSTVGRDVKLHYCYYARV